MSATIATHPWNTTDNSPYVDVSQAAIKHLDRPIIKVVVNVTLAITWRDDLVSHFRLFLVVYETEDAAESIEVNSTSDEKEGATILRVIYRPYASSEGKNVLANRAIPIVSHVTVGDVLHMLLDKGRHKYTLDAKSGSGCVYWVKTVLGDFVAYKWIEHGGEDIIDVMERDIRKENPDVDLPDPSPKGRFF